MLQRSLLINGLVLLRSIISGIIESLSLFVFWTLIRWLCLELKFDFISATLGLSIGIIVYWINIIKRSINLKKLGLLLSIMIQIFVYFLAGGFLYKQIINFGDVSANYQMIVGKLIIVVVVIFIIAKVLDFIINKIINSLFNNHEGDFELIQASTMYNIHGQELHESYRYKLKTWNLFDIQYIKYEASDDFGTAVKK